MKVSTITIKIILMFCLFLSVLLFSTTVLGKTSINSSSLNSVISNTNSDAYPYPPSDQSAPLLLLESQSYPAPPSWNPDSSSEQILEVPVDHLVVVTNNGTIEELNSNSTLGYTIDDVGNSIVFPNPGNPNLLQDEINNDVSETDRVIG